MEKKCNKKVYDYLKGKKNIVILVILELFTTQALTVGMNDGRGKKT